MPFLQPAAGGFGFRLRGIVQGGFSAVSCTTWRGSCDWGATSRTRRRAGDRGGRRSGRAGSVRADRHRATPPAGLDSGKRNREVERLGEDASPSGQRRVAGEFAWYPDVATCANCFDDLPAGRPAFRLSPSPTAPTAAALHIVRTSYDGPRTTMSVFPMCEACARNTKTRPTALHAQRMRSRVGPRRPPRSRSARPPRGRRILAI